jgi:hypothetical protein
MIFRLLVKFKVMIMLNDSHSRKKALVITRTSDRVVGFKTGERASYIYNIQYLFSPVLFMLVGAIRAMRQLHTIHFSDGCSSPQLNKCSCGYEAQASQKASKGT